MSRLFNATVFMLFMSILDGRPSTGMSLINDRCGTAGHQASAEIATADQLLTQKNARQAAQVLDKALQILGNRYVDSRYIDDTGMYLIVAQLQQDKGKFAQAAAIRRDVLAERLRLCRTGSGQTAPPARSWFACTT